MADDWYDDDIKLINSLRGGGKNAYRRNPVMEDFFSAAQGTQQLFANQAKMNAFSEAMAEKKALKNALGGMDMEKPQYGKLLALAPVFTQKLMDTMGEVKKEDRLKVAQAATNVNSFLGQSLPLLAQNPQTRPSLVKEAMRLGASQEYVDAVIPKPEDFQGNPEGWVKAIGGSLDFGNLMKQETEKIKGNLKIEGEKTKGEYRYKTEALKAESAQIVQGSKEAITRMQTSGKETLFQDEEGNYHSVRPNPFGGGPIKTDLPKGWKPQEKKPAGGKGTKETKPDEYGRPGGEGKQPKVYETLPPASEFSGKIATDQATGKRMKSNGKTWEPVD